MDGFISWVGGGFAALVAVAVAVAWWEHLQRRLQAQQAPLLPESPGLPAVDVALDVLTPPAPEGDAAARRQALGSALERMAQAGSAADRHRGWADTLPMVGPGLLERPPADAPPAVIAPVAGAKSPPTPRPTEEPTPTQH